MERSIYCYQLSPIDFFEGPLLTFSLTGDEDSDVSRLWDAARAGFEALGIGKRMREGPYLFHIPHGDSLKLCLLLKEDNNGNTYVAAPMPLPFLDEAVGVSRTAVVTCRVTGDEPAYEARIM